MSIKEHYTLIKCVNKLIHHFVLKFSQTLDLQNKMLDKKILLTINNFLTCSPLSSPLEVIKS